MNIVYRHLGTFYDTVSDNYGRSRLITQSEEIAIVVLAGVTLTTGGQAESTGSASTAYVDPKADFVTTNINRLNGMWLAVDSVGLVEWYRVTGVTVNRNHLLGNRIDNIELSLVASEALPLVS